MSFHRFCVVPGTDGPSEAATAYINAYEGQDIETGLTDRKYSSHVVHPGIGLVMATQVTNFNKSFKQMLSWCAIVIPVDFCFFLCCGYQKSLLERMNMVDLPLTDRDYSGNFIGKTRATLVDMQFDDHMLIVSSYVAMIIL